MRIRGAGEFSGRNKSAVEWLEFRPDMEYRVGWLGMDSLRAEKGADPQLPIPRRFRCNIERDEMLDGIIESGKSF